MKEIASYLYVKIFEDLWNKLLEDLYQGNSPENTRKKYVNVVFEESPTKQQKSEAKEKGKDIFNVEDYFLCVPYFADVKTKTKTYFYKLYLDAKKGKDIKIDSAAFCNIAEYLEYALPKSENISSIGLKAGYFEKLILDDFLRENPGFDITLIKKDPLLELIGRYDDLVKQLLAIQKSSLQSVMDLIQFEDDKPELTRNLSFLLHRYSNEKKRFVERHGIYAPYVLIHDYTKETIDNWGTYEFSDDFQLVPQLEAGLNEAVHRNNASLTGNSTIVRVQDLEKKQGELKFSLQKAKYHQQVATNMNLDWKIPPERFNEGDIDNIRDWDLAQANCDDELPPFSKSQLANSIGVAIAIYIRKNGEKVYLTRKRSTQPMTFGGTVHLLFSFALKINLNNTTTPNRGTIKDLIRPCFEDEQLKELGFLDKSYDRVKPIAFTRELGRGGKPQFFLEMEARGSIEDLQNKISEQQMLPEYLPKSIGQNFSFSTFGETQKEIEKMLVFIRQNKISSELFGSMLLTI